MQTVAMNHYNSPYHQSYSIEDDAPRHQRTRRRSRHEDNDRFMSGSSRNFDQAPSIHVTKSRGHSDENDVDCSERSFQLGMDPIERDWGDSMSRDYRGGKCF